jgi:hypothetical protein
LSNAIASLPPETSSGVDAATLKWKESRKRNAVMVNDSFRPRINENSRKLAELIDRSKYAKG